jgi:hypothetical protein
MKIFMIVYFTLLFTLLTLNESLGEYTKILSLRGVKLIMNVIRAVSPRDELETSCTFVLQILHANISRIRRLKIKINRYKIE